jgi:methylated-DNA-[protein]-cysteine S-methyltransferase
MTSYTTTIHSPVGPLLALADDDGLRTIVLPNGAGNTRRTATAARTTPDHPTLRALRDQLHEYFAGTRSTFDLPLVPVGTEFQLRAWQALRKIPFGETRSYKQQAEAIGRPTAVRAIGAANGKNPLPIVVPCHRVIGADGSLTGFGGGLAAKRFLLELEGVALGHVATAANRPPDR